MAVDTALTTTTVDETALAAEVVVKGDLAKLSEPQRLAYVTAVCRSLGLNPLTRPFELIQLNGKLTLYATKGCTDQLRALRGVTVTGIEPRAVGDLYVVTASGRDRDGREDVSTGAVAIKGLSGEYLANAMMKAETKAKRRLTLSLAGLGFPDESEVESIPSTAVDAEPKLTLAERAAARAAAIVDTADPVVPEPEPAASIPAEPVVEPEPTKPAAPQSARAKPQPTAVPVVQTPAPAPLSAVPSAAASDVEVQGLCLAPSPYGDGAACTMPAGHDQGQRKVLHRTVSMDGEILATW